MAGSLQLAGLNETIATRAYQSSDLKPKTGAANALAHDTRLSSRATCKRGDQGVDALHYTERTRTASNNLRCPD